MALRVAGLAGGAVAWWQERLRALTAWAARRSVAPTSLAGISVLLALCSAAWLSGGGFADTIRGAIAVCGWYAASFAAGALAAYPATERGRPHPRAQIRQVIKPAHARYGSTDWLVLPGLTWGSEPGPGATTLTLEAGEAAAACAETGPGEVARADSRGVGWLAAICTVAAECAIYGGIAAGGQGRADWLLAVVAIASVALTEMAVACRSGSVHPPVGGPGAAPVRGRGFWRVTDMLAAPSAGWRVLIAMVLLIAAGVRIALFAVLVVEVISLCWVIAAASFGWATARFGQPAGHDALLRCRDDGPAARWTGRLVHGGLLPLPPVLAGLFATTALIVLAGRSLPGFLVMTPPVVMMLAGPGSSHPHDGRLDWLVPVLLAVAQYVYLAALGFAALVPGAAVFAACAMLAIWQASLAACGPALGMSGIGWEGRMFGLGLAAIFGFEILGFVALAALLGALTCRNIAVRYLVPGAERSP